VWLVNDRYQLRADMYGKRAAGRPVGGTDAPQHLSC
jgi:hypothetical protein